MTNADEMVEQIAKTILGYKLHDSQYYNEEIGIEKARSLARAILTNPNLLIESDDTSPQSKAGLYFAIPTINLSLNK